MRCRGGNLIGKEPCRAACENFERKKDNEKTTNRPPKRLGETSHGEQRKLWWTVSNTPWNNALKATLLSTLFCEGTYRQSTVSTSSRHADNWWTRTKGGGRQLNECDVATPTSKRGATTYNDGFIKFCPTVWTSNMLTSTNKCIPNSGCLYIWNMWCDKNSKSDCVIWKCHL